MWCVAHANTLHAAAALAVEGEEPLGGVVCDHLHDELLGHDRVLVLEALRLDRRAVDGEVVVVEQLLIQVRRQRGVGDASLVAQLSPRLHVLVVDVLGDALEVELGGARDHRAPEAGRDAEDLLEDLVELLLVRVGLVGEVVDRPARQLLRGEDHGAAHVVHVDGVQAQVAAPHELHLLAKLLVHGGADDAGRDDVGVAGAVDVCGAQDHQRDADLGELRLRLEVHRGKVGPRLELAVFLGRLLVRLVHLGGRQVDELVAATALRLLGDLDGEREGLFLVDGDVLTELALRGAVEDIVELAAREVEALGNRL